VLRTKRERCDPMSPNFF